MNSFTFPSQLIKLHVGIQKSVSSEWHVHQHADLLKSVIVSVCIWELKLKQYKNMSWRCLWVQNFKKFAHHMDSTKTKSILASLLRCITTQYWYISCTQKRKYQVQAKAGKVQVHGASIYGNFIACNKDQGQYEKQKELNALLLTPIKVEMRRIMPVIQARVLLTSNTSQTLVELLVLVSSNHLEIRADEVTSTMPDSSLLYTIIPTILPEFQQRDLKNYKIRQDTTKKGQHLSITITSHTTIFSQLSPNQMGALRDVK